MRPMSATAIPFPLSAAIPTLRESSIRRPIFPWSGWRHFCVQNMTWTRKRSSGIMMWRKRTAPSILWKMKTRGSFSRRMWMPLWKRRSKKNKQTDGKWRKQKPAGGFRTSVPWVWGGKTDQNQEKGEEKQRWTIWRCTGNSLPCAMTGSSTFWRSAIRL